MSNMEDKLVKIYITGKIAETKKAWLFKFKYHRDVNTEISSWFPKSQCKEGNEPDTIMVREWLVKSRAIRESARYLTDHIERMQLLEGFDRMLKEKEEVIQNG